jgi:hypothetical protein
LADVLGLLAEFRSEELRNAGVLAGVLAGLKEASALIDRAMKTPAPLEIKREELKAKRNQLLERLLKNPLDTLACRQSVFVDLPSAST